MAGSEVKVREILLPAIGPVEYTPHCYAIAAEI